MNLEQKIKNEFATKKHLVKKPAKGYLKYDYLVPGGPYDEQWDWDAFFIGLNLMAELSTEAIYLKNWCLNYFDNMRPSGFTPGLVTPKGMDVRLNHMKPLLAQGAYHASKFLNDFSWLKPHWSKIKKITAYRQKQHFDKKTGLVAWHNGMESGADNNVCLLYYPKGVSLSTDLNAFLYLEYKAMVAIAKKLKLKGDSKKYQKKAADLSKAMMKHMWNDQDKVFYNIDVRNRRHIKRVSHANIIPLWAGIAPRDKGRQMIKKYVLNPKKLWSKNGIRSLNADDPEYNNVNIIKPYSNWQGSIWVNFNYMAMHGLINYGFKKEALEVAERIAKVCLNDIDKRGMMHENYDADTGAPLAAPNFVSWNLLADQMIPEAKAGHNPFLIS